MSRSPQIDDRPTVAAPGSVVVVRDEEWLVTQVERASDGWFVHVLGLSELVRDTESIFSTAIDRVELQDPASATVVADHSPQHRLSRLWLEATVRKASLPLNDPTLGVSTQGLADPLSYQLTAVRKALDPGQLRPRILLADAVGLGKTLEIGMILSELARRGRGERILVVTPRHVLEQMQFELWTRFALPFVRLDSVGIQRIRQKLPANRNPFAFFKRIIISIDTLKADRYLSHLQKQYWDAVVIDESHNVTNSASQNNRLARLLSVRTDALILASATPHNGKAESFAELVGMLEPSAVRPDGTVIEEEVRRLVIRRHRHSPEVASVVGADWAERHEPQNILVPASPEEDRIAEELERVWLYPPTGDTPRSGAGAQLFPWTLAKSFLSSPAALKQSVVERRRRVASDDRPGSTREAEALARLESLADEALAGRSAKLDALAERLRDIGVGRRSPMRAVVFAERVATLHWLQDHLRDEFGLAGDQVRVLHGGLSDVEQQEIVESFKQESSPIRILVTGDVASEGVNLHLQCHHLFHFDIPWSLIRIEQRNGRIDRYGQKHRPRITTLLLSPSGDQFAGDLRVLQRLVEKEHQAHRQLGDSASLMGKYDVAAEEEAIRQVLAGEKDLDEVVAEPDDVTAGTGIDALLARLAASASLDSEGSGRVTPDDGHLGIDTEGSGSFPDALSFLDDALTEIYQTPAHPSPNGVGWMTHRTHAITELEPPVDLRPRLEVLPQSYLRDRRVLERLKLATTITRGQAELTQARSDESTSLWPEAHYLAPLHPVLDWATDRVLAKLGRNEVFVVRGEVDSPTVLLHGTLTNQRGQVVTSTYLLAEFPNPSNLSFAPVSPHGSARAALAALGVAGPRVNTGGVPDPDRWTRYVAPAVRAAGTQLGVVVGAVEERTRERVRGWMARMEGWDDEADALIQRRTVRDRRHRVQQEQELARAMQPAQQMVRPLLVVIPEEDAAAEGD